MAKLGGEFAVNSTTTDEPLDQHVAALTGGGFVVVWSSDNSGSSDIKAQIFDSDGGTVGDEFVVNSTTTGRQYQPDVAALSGGGFVVTWTDRTGADGNVDGVLAQVFDANGDTVGDEFVVNTNTTLDQETSAVTGYGDNGFFVVWKDAGGEIAGQRFTGPDTKAGSEFGVNLLINNTGVGALDANIITLEGGNVVVGWHDNLPSTDDDFRGQVFNPATGSRVGSEFLIDETASGTPLFNTLTALTDGRFVAAWSESSGIVVRIFNADGTAATGEVLVTNDGYDFEQSATVVALADGAFTVVWHEQQPQPDTSALGVVAQDFAADGTKMGGAYLVNTTIVGNQYTPSATALGGDRFVVTWNDNGTLKGQIFVVNLAPSGGVSIDGTADEDQTLTADTSALTDGNGLGALHYEWQRDGGSGYVTVGSDQGTYVLGDADVGATIRVIVSYTDGGGNAEVVESAATGAVQNVNDQPVVDQAITGQKANRGLQWVFQVAADAFSDADGDTLTYSASLGSDAPLPDWLSFNPTDRTFTGTAPGDAPASLTIKVSASDGALSASQTFVLTINSAPIITSDGGGSSASVFVAENLSAVTTVTASDSADVPTFQIVGGDDAALFTVNAVTGDLTFIAAPDFEAAADSNRDNIYEVVVAASDGLLTDTQALSVSVTNVKGPNRNGGPGNQTLLGTSEEENINGGGGRDVLNGRAGNDRLNGGPGNDRLIGGPGMDVMTGGANSDLFDFDKVTESRVGGMRDRILDFRHSQHDRIDLRTIDADTVHAGNQAFKFIGSQSFAQYHAKHHNVWGMVRYAGGTVQITVDRDMAPEMEIRAVGAADASDFFL